VEKAVSIRALGNADVDAVLAIQAASPQAARWSRADYEDLTRKGMHGWVGVAEGAESGAAEIGRASADAPRVAGFVLARFVAGEMEILNLAVLPDSRRRGLGSMLVREALRHAALAGCTKAFLEVRASNGPGIAFYQAHGFALAGHRAHYYRDPPEDALLLARRTSSE
jgi:ribosomal-protein-alanine acetyltransferase